jgi:hypothetical protein
MRKIKAPPIEQAISARLGCYVSTVRLSATKLPSHGRWRQIRRNGIFHRDLRGVRYFSAESDGRSFPLI